MKLNVYLSLNGSCKEAFEFYQSVLGGEIVMMMPFAGSPAEAQVPDDWKDKVMHVTLQVGDMSLMGSDGMPEHYVKPQGYHVSVAVDDPKDAERVFGELSEGGQITMPIDKTFWAQRFGMFTDKFGINWMVNCE